MSLDHSPSCGNKFSRENFCLPRSKLGQTNNFLVVLFLTNEKYTKVQSFEVPVFHGAPLLNFPTLGCLKNSYFLALLHYAELKVAIIGNMSFLLKKCQLTHIQRRLPLQKKYFSPEISVNQLSYSITLKTGSDGFASNLLPTHSVSISQAKRGRV